MRRFRGIILLVLAAAWMCLLTVAIFKFPKLFLDPSIILGESGEARPVPEPSDDTATTQEPDVSNKVATPQDDLREIVVAKMDLEWGTVLEETMFDYKSYPRAQPLPEGVIESDRAVDMLGQILMVDIQRDEPFLQYKLHRDQARLIEDRTEINKRAMAVKVDEVVGVAGYIKPYSRVDVLVTLRNRQPPVTRTVLRNVLVLAAGAVVDRISPSALDTVTTPLANISGQTNPKSEKQGPTKVSVVTLQVSPEEAEKLALASSEGKLRLALKNPRDKEVADSSRGVNLTELLGKPVRPPRRRVVVIKGSEVKTRFVKP